MERDRYDYYNHGNLATNPVRQPERKKVVKRKKVVRSTNVELLKNRLKFIGFVLYVFTLSLVYVIGYSQISGRQEKMDSLQRELAEITKQNLLLQEQIEEVNDLNYIYNKATKDLKMVTPDTNQVKYITIAKVDFSEKLGEPVADTDKRIRFKFAN